MPILRKLALLFAVSALLNHARAADTPAPAPAAQPKEAAKSRAVMTGDQVVQILDETVDWYRTLGAQQQSANQPSDLLILYANRQTADKVINLAFEIARANAELLSSDAEEAARSAATASASSREALVQLQKQLETRLQSTQEEIASLERQLATAPKERKADAQVKLAELKSEIDLMNARRNLLSTTSRFAYQSDADGSGTSALKQHIDAIEASIPSTSGGPAPASSAASASAAPAAAATTSTPSLLNPQSENTPRRVGIWDLTANVLRLSAKINTIDAIDQRTAALQDTFTKIRALPLQQIKALSTRGDALAQQADSASGTALKAVRDQTDTLAWLFNQTAAILIPLSQEGVLLDQYRHNLKSWRDAVHNQYRDALKALGVRVALLVAMLAVVFVLAEVWRRTVLRYAHEPRRRYQLLLVRKIVLWSLVIAIVGFTFATELGSLVTFAGLITAGLAVAMQSVLVSIVGYFFLIGKYGIRVGDRVQIGPVTGEVIDLGLARLHLMELSGGQGSLGPTGRVVAFANSIVFQASGGIFKQIPGVNLAWHEITLALPPNADPTAIKEELGKAAAKVIYDYRDDLARQTKEIQKTTSSHAKGDALPQVQLRFSVESVDAIVRYPVQVQRAAEIDEHMSRELLNVIKTAAAA